MLRTTVLLFTTLMLSITGISQTTANIDTANVVDEAVLAAENAQIYSKALDKQIANSNWGEWFQIVFYGNTIQYWIISLLIILGSVIVGKLVYWAIGSFLKKLTSKTKSKLDDILVDKLEEPIVFVVIITGIWWGFNRLNFTVNIHDFFSHVFTIVYTLNIAWMIARTMDALIEEYIVPLTEKTESDLDDQLLPIVRKGVRFIIWTMGIIVGLNNAGFDVAALIAGLGIGGLALALAAQDTVKNVFGGIMVFLDKPFKIGDRVRIEGFDGMIDEIGLRSTRLRTLSGTLVTIPNSKFSENSVENITLEPTRKVVLNLGLTYDTQPDEIQKAISLLNEIGKNHKMTEDEALVSFNAWGDFALGLLFIYYIKKEGDILQVQTDINLEILKRFNAEKLEFAFPTQTILHQKLPDAVI